MSEQLKSKLTVVQPKPSTQFNASDWRVEITEALVGNLSLPRPELQTELANQMMRLVEANWNLTWNRQAVNRVGNSCDFVTVMRGTYVRVTIAWHSHVVWLGLQNEERDS